MWLISHLQEVPKSQRRQAGFINAEKWELLALKYFCKCCSWDLALAPPHLAPHWHHTWHHHTGAGKPGIPDISPKPDFAFHSNKAFPLSHDQTFISTPLTRSIGQMFVISFICGGAGLYFYICVFHRLLHFLCTEDLSIRQAPHYHRACNLPEQCLRKGGRGHLYGTPSARPPRDKSNPWQTKPPIASCGLHLISCRTIFHHTSLLVFRHNKQYEIISKNFAFRSREVSPTAQHHFDIRRKKIFIDDDNISKLCVVMILPSINIDEFQNPCFFPVP